VGFTLTRGAREFMAAIPHKRKAESAQRLLNLKQQLADYTPRGEGTAIQLGAEQIAAAIHAHRAFLKTPGRNMLVPRPKPAEDKNRRPGQWRRPDGKRRPKP
ncbi:MAG: hypothetical protein K9J80_15990, partial [Sulfuritalea sp.]|nr:hypothetical protein [Sulfuritalea sp.]